MKNYQRQYLRFSYRFALLKIASQFRWRDIQPHSVHNPRDFSATFNCLLESFVDMVQTISTNVAVSYLWCFPCHSDHHPRPRPFRESLWIIVVNDDLDVNDKKEL